MIKPLEMELLPLNYAISWVTNPINDSPKATLIQSHVPAPHWVEVHGDVGSKVKSSVTSYMLASTDLMTTRGHQRSLLQEGYIANLITMAVVPPTTSCIAPM